MRPKCDCFVSVLKKCEQSQPLKYHSFQTYYKSRPNDGGEMVPRRKSAASKAEFDAPLNHTPCRPDAKVS